MLQIWGLVKSIVFVHPLITVIVSKGFTGHMIMGLRSVTKCNKGGTNSLLE